MAVEDRLAVLDAIGQSASGHRLPAFALSQLASRVDDDLAPLGSLSAFYKHAQVRPPDPGEPSPPAPPRWRHGEKRYNPGIRGPRRPAGKETATARRSALSSQERVPRTGNMGDPYP